ncbi:4-carboxymuconolactone decarboxylase [Parafrankia sp. EUN1f]|uniref:bifunctional 3-oxoadipate enol-lactonase/4-carboxymuconolactone decarboxylase PcaDC n=1 Tax=Parafrankia sp. EUN1f TaxID=102897 RepID=UPI0001C46D36|nr:4-carboxymuconolactone decarboxylase [Parafrankia sp. EUN1f]EFC80055.1 4-carboxymuconolactone decarboxylase [Parafrankia sp. EUN1f]
MTIPRLRTVELAGRPGLPLLVVGPSLGTSAKTLWSAVAKRLGDRFHVVGWDLPGHGGCPVGEPFSIADLASGALECAAEVAAVRGDDELSFRYAGSSLGGAVGLQLLLDAPTAVDRAVLVCTGARIGEPASWRERAAAVRGGGMEAVVTASAQRWFAPGFVEREPATASTLLDALRHTDSEGYAQACEALAGFDVRERLAGIGAPLLAIAGAADAATPPESLRQIASQVPGGRLEVLGDVAHQAPAEAPARVADLMRDFLAAPAPATVREIYDAGMVVRREVLGDTHVDRATAAITDFTAEFQELITTYAWGTIWTRPGLDRRSRSMITLTALIARGHHEELAMHVRAALRNGLTTEEIKEVILQSAIYCGVPDANTAFRVAAGIIAEDTTR